MNEKKEHIEISRPDWHSFFLWEAAYWASRSHDSQTQFGCVFVKNNVPISHGYNGFIRGINDTVLPNTRPKKYQFMIHCEQNAICNAASRGISCDGATAYVSGRSCLTCLQLMWQAGIKDIIYTDFQTPQMIENQEYLDNWNLLVSLMPGLNVTHIPKECLYTAHIVGIGLKNV